MAIKCMEGPFVFRLNDNGTGPHLLVQVCTERGWREYAGENNVFKDRWNLWWRSGGFPASHYRPLLPWQFVNRIPKGNSICRKDKLIRHLKRMKKVHGSIYDFSPAGYNLPSEYTKLAEECSRCEKDDKVWICKPVGQSQGRGIFLFRKLSDLSYDNAAIVQRYIENPLLIGGYKFDLRLYVCVPSYRPLTIYLHKEGLARFATEKFSLERLDDPFRHLTNFSLNKLGPGYSEKKERIGAGCKWTFRQLRRYFEQSGYSDWILWQRISCLVTLTILSQAAGIPRSSNCFEFFGFDVLIDENLKPWLLEVNLSPALSNDCEVDSEVKKPLLHDLFDLLGLPVCNTGLSLFTIWSTSDRIEEDDGEVSSRFGRSVKKRSKLGREAENLLNLSSETRATLRQSTPEVCPTTWPRYNPLLMDKYIRRYKGNTIENHAAPPIWDNGRDWRASCVREGGWIRICPFIRTKHIENTECTRPSPRAVENEIKNMVLSIQKYLKAAKEVQQRNEKLTDEQCNALLQSELQLNTEIWLPEK
ncbi:PREDICTED: probable tubulin polyglutamylase TTLL2 isoform X1 [Vollenhovia emeryi]|uniref:probable tubulin polyglutamylase TTLL2 isoform X1 n=2 Tax=Vollenhovia emeryi TaxID=411798 RepID=UPI0005F4054B|nr:PREDICTED: probable tubulin polyglutamylase TTLL2 isoform X1 [Vollenhovia emeryi]XP_011872997.1 PREDICTED: probable tubulin polyglutamylase TTLL2 isoform X1 [Vollenhovia emeryi]